MALGAATDGRERNGCTDNGDGEMRGLGEGFVEDLVGPGGRLAPDTACCSTPATGWMRRPTPPSTWLRQRSIPLARSTGSSCLPQMHQS